MLTTMKTLFCIFFALTLISKTYAEPIRLSAPVQQDDTSETFGAPLSEIPALTELPMLLESPDAYLDKRLALKLKVSKVCQKKGCFFIAQHGDQSIRVSFKDYGFFVPTDIGGKSVTLVGVLSKQEVSTAQAKHLSTDLGEKGSVESGAQYQIIASSVRVPNHQEQKASDT